MFALGATSRVNRKIRLCDRLFTHTYTTVLYPYIGQRSQTVASTAEAADLILCSCRITSIYTNQSPGAAAILPQAPPAPGHGL